MEHIIEVYFQLQMRWLRVSSLETRNFVDESVVDTVCRIETIGQDQFNEYPKLVILDHQSVFMHTLKRIPLHEVVDLGGYFSYHQTMSPLSTSSVVTILPSSEALYSSSV